MGVAPRKCLATGSGSMAFLKQLMLLDFDDFDDDDDDDDDDKEEEEEVMAEAVCQSKSHLHCFELQLLRLLPDA